MQATAKAGVIYIDIFRSGPRLRVSGLQAASFADGAILGAFSPLRGALTRFESPILPLKNRPEGGFLENRGFEPLTY
jgi:hypothetical protein